MMAVVVAIARESEWIPLELTAYGANWKLTHVEPASGGVELAVLEPIFSRDGKSQPMNGMALAETLNEQLGVVCAEYGYLR